MAKGDVRKLVFGAGSAAHQIGEVLQTVATRPGKLVEVKPPLLPIEEDDALFLADTMSLVRYFGWTAVVGSTFIVRFKTPLHRVGEGESQTYSLKGVKMLLTHPHLPTGKKITVDITKDVIISKALLPDAALLQLIEMDCTVDAKGRLCLTPYPGVGYAYPAFEAPQPVKLWTTK